MLPTAKKLPSGKWRARAYDYTDADGKLPEYTDKVVDIFDQEFSKKQEKKA